MIRDIRYSQKVSWIKSLGDISVFLILIAAFWIIMMPKAPTFLIKNTFPWLEIFVLAITLRYGLASGLIFIFGIFGITMLFTHHYNLHAFQNGSLFVGYLVSVILCAEFKTYWSRKDSILVERNNYLSRQFEKLVYQFSMLQLSHDRLEQSLISKPVSLRQALQELSQLLSQKEGGELTSSIASRYLQLLAYYCNMERAGLYLLQHGQLAETPIASFGLEDVNLQKSPLIDACLENENTVYFSVTSLKFDQYGAYIAAVPFKNSEGHLMGVLLIQEMPFLSFSDETLEQLSLLLSYVADSYSDVHESHAIIERYPFCPSSFAFELIQLIYCAKKFDIESTLFVFHIQSKKYSSVILNEIQQQKRGLDLMFSHEKNDVIICCVLLPLTSINLSNLYLDRIRNLLSERHNIRFHEDDNYITYNQIGLLKVQDGLTLLGEIFGELVEENLSVDLPSLS
ncbi:MAG: hypothetical protein HKM04_04420 [Legionellales bacterium]|nr:hypothetical protein [Legionellales bacterium]